jgi:hypothetical protein
MKYCPVCGLFDRHTPECPTLDARATAAIANDGTEPRASASGLTEAAAKQLFRQLDTIIEDAVVIKSHLRQGDPDDVIELATNIEGLAQMIQESIGSLENKDAELFRTLFADL